MKRALGALVGVLLAVGCGRAAVPPAPAQPAAPKSTVTLPLQLLHDRPDGQSLLREASLQATTAGVLPLQVLAAGPVAASDHVGGFVAVSPESCLLAVARASSEIDDLDVLVFDDEGATVAADQSIGPKAAVLVCPPHARRLYVSARVASGQGFAAVGVQVVPPDEAAVVAQHTGARTDTGRLSSSASAWPGFEARIDERRQALRGRWQEIRRSAAPVTPRAWTYVSGALPANRCLDILLWPDEEAGYLDVTVLDESGRHLQRASGLGRERSAVVCSPIDTTITIGVRPHTGYGLVAISMAQSEPGAELELAQQPDVRVVGPMEELDAVRTRLHTRLTTAGYQSPLALGRGQLTAGVMQTVPVQLPQGCSRLDVLVGKPLIGVRAWLWNDSDQQIATAAGGERATLFGCVTRRTQAQLQIQGNGRPGPYVVEMRREQTAASNDVKQLSLAASRMLQRSEATNHESGLRGFGSIHRLRLDENTRATLPLRVPVRRCQDVVVAADAGAVGLQLRVVRDDDGAELTTARGADVALVHVCATVEPIKAQLFVTVEAGRADALAGVLAAEEMPAGR